MLRVMMCHCEKASYHAFALVPFGCVLIYFPLWDMYIVCSRTASNNGFVPHEFSAQGYSFQSRLFIVLWNHLHTYIDIIVYSLTYFCSSVVNPLKWRERCTRLLAFDFERAGRSYFRMEGRASNNICWELAVRVKIIFFNVRFWVLYDVCIYEYV